MFRLIYLVKNYLGREGEIRKRENLGIQRCFGGLWEKEK